MTHKQIEKIIAVMGANNVRYNKKFDIMLDLGFYSDAAESLAEEICGKLSEICEVADNAGFNPALKKAAVKLVNMVLKCGDEKITVAGLTKLQQEYRKFASTIKLPEVTKQPTVAAPSAGAEVVTEYNCRRCGGALLQKGEAQLKCKYCGSTYDMDSVLEDTKKMHDMFDTPQRETVNNLIKNLYDAVNAEYVSSEDVKNACLELKKHIPDDFRANFYLTVIGNNIKDINAAIRAVDVNRYYDDIEAMVKFLIKSLETEFLLELNNLIERAYKNRNIMLYGKYATEISQQADKVAAGVYSTKLPREVFVAYSSKDMQHVSELVEVLERQGLNCFVAARNLRHGKGSVEDYESAIKEAIDNCKTIVFVSTTNSRSFGCDAIKIELPYVKKHDLENSPLEYRNNYEAIPHKYKKPRVEYRVESSTYTNAADRITSEFFHGYEWVLSPDAVADRVVQQLVGEPE